MKVKVIIYKASDGTYWCRTESEVYGCMLNGCGGNVEEAKEDMNACLEEARLDYEETHSTAPYTVSFLYRYDLQSFFDYFSFLNISEIARRSGINPSLMRQYVSGNKAAGEKTYSKLSACITNISNELQAASFR